MKTKPISQEYIKPTVQVTKLTNQAVSIIQRMIVNDKKRPKPCNGKRIDLHCLKNGKEFDQWIDPHLNEKIELQDTKNLIGKLLQHATEEDIDELIDLAYMKKYFKGMYANFMKYKIS